MFLCNFILTISTTGRLLPSENSISQEAEMEKIIELVNAKPDSDNKTDNDKKFNEIVDDLIESIKDEKEKENEKKEEEKEVEIEFSEIEKQEIDNFFGGEDSPFTFPEDIEKEEKELIDNVKLKNKKNLEDTVESIETTIKNDKIDHVPVEEIKNEEQVEFVDDENQSNLVENDENKINLIVDEEQISLVNNKQFQVDEEIYFGDSQNEMEKKTKHLEIQKENELVTVSYTHLTLPTTPYV